MSSRNGRYLATLGGLALLLCVTPALAEGAQRSIDHGANSGERTPAHEASNAHPAGPKPPAVAAVKPPPIKQQGNNGDDKPAPSDERRPPWKVPWAFFDAHNGSFNAVFSALVAMFTLLLFFVGRDQHKRLKETIDHARVSSRQELRAYLSAQIGGMSNVRSGQSPTVQVMFHNRGNTPAYDVSGTAEVFLVDARGWIPIPQEEEIISTDRTVAPGGDYALNSTNYFCLLDRGIDELRDNKASIVIAGVVRYRDAFGETHHTRFSHTYIGIPPAGRYNDWGNGAD